MKTNTKYWLRGSTAGLVFGSMVLLAGGCSFHKSVVHESSTTAPAPAVAAYDYEYYPAANVYYDPAHGKYYWFEDGRWHSGHRLPSKIVIAGIPPEHVRYTTPEPWLEHEQGYGH